MRAWVIGFAAKWVVNFKLRISEHPVNLGKSVRIRAPWHSVFFVFCRLMTAYANHVRTKRLAAMNFTSALPPHLPQSNYQCNICSTGMMHKEMTSAVTGFGRKRLSEATTGSEALVSVGQCTANGGSHNVQQGLEGPHQLGCVPVRNWVIAHMEWPVMSGISPIDDGLNWINMD